MLRAELREEEEEELIINKYFFYDWAFKIFSFFFTCSV